MHLKGHSKLTSVQKSDRHYNDRWDDTQIMRWKDRMREWQEWADGREVYTLPDEFDRNDRQAAAELAFALRFVDALTGCITDTIGDRCWGTVENHWGTFDDKPGPLCGLPARMWVDKYIQDVATRHRPTYTKHARQVRTAAWRSYARMAERVKDLSADWMMQTQHRRTIHFGEDAPGLRYRMPDPVHDADALSALVSEVNTRVSWAWSQLDPVLKMDHNS